MKLKYIFYSAIFSLAIACGGISDGRVEDIIEATPCFTEPVYAPFRVGEVTIPRADRDKPKEYIDRIYGELVAAGMVTTSEPIEKSWKSVVRITLTPEGEKLADPKADSLNRRVRPVKVCGYKLAGIKSLTENEAKNEAVCIYQYETSDITPFGKFLNVKSGISYADTCKLAKNDAGEWVIMK